MTLEAEALGPDQEPAEPIPAGLGDFRQLWAGQTVSLLGMQVSALALPVTAAVALEASANDMGLLRAAEFAPYLFLGLFAGVWADRKRRRPVLIATDVGRAALLATVPAAALLGALRLEYLYLIALLVGALGVFSDVAGQAFLPSLVGRKSLAEANGRLEVSRALAAILGPALAGPLMAWLTAPVAVAATSLSFLASAACVVAIRRSEPAALLPADRRGWAELREGLDAIVGHPILRALAGAAAITNLFVNVLLAVLVFFLIRELNVSVAATSGVFVAFGFGSVLGAVLAPRLGRRIGAGRVILAAPLGNCAAAALVATAGLTPLPPFVQVVAGAFVYGFALAVWLVQTAALRQRLTPDRLQGRINASYRVIAWGTIPIGALLGGLLGELLGPRLAVLTGAGGAALAVPVLLLSPLTELDE